MSERKRRSRSKTPAKQTIEGTKRIWVTPFKDAAEVETVEKDIHIFETDPAFVRVAAGQTLNMGDYNSMRVDVAITMPCYAEMVDETQTECANWVANRLQLEIDEYLGEDG